MALAERELPQGTRQALVAGKRGGANLAGKRDENPLPA